MQAQISSFPARPRALGIQKLYGFRKLKHGLGEMFS